MAYLVVVLCASVESEVQVVSSYRFRLYVAGQTERTRAAMVNMRRLCESRLAGRYELEVVDTLERPDVAEVDAILIAPTVVRLEPLPQRRVFGDLSDHPRVVAALGLPDWEESDAGAVSS